MKILFFTDTQADVCHYGFTDVTNKENTRFSDSIDIFTQVRVCAEKEKCDTIVFGGDLHEKRDPKLFVKNKVNEVIKTETSKNKNINWLFIPGNHDQDSKSVLSDDSLRTLTIFNDSIPNVEVVHEFKRYIHDDVVMYCFAHSWFHKDAFEVLRKDVEEKHKDKKIVLVFHESIGGAKMPNGMTIKAGINKTDLKKLSDLVSGKLVVLAGHIHSREYFSKEYLGGYCGCPLQITKDDEKEVKGWWVVDTDKWELKFIQSESPMIKSLEFDSIDELNEFKFTKEYNGNILRIYIHGDQDEFKSFNKEDFKQKLYKENKIRAIKIEQLPPQIELSVIEIPSIVKSKSIDEDMSEYVNCGLIKGIKNILSSELLEVGREINNIVLSDMP